MTLGELRRSPAAPGDLQRVRPGPVRIRDEQRPMPDLAESAWRAFALFELIAIVGILLWPR